MRLLFGHFSTRFSLIVLAAVFLASAPGCGEAETSLDRKPISGTVSYEGKTDYNGKVLFTPTGGGPAASTNIQQGRYEFSTATGPMAGKYTVRIEVRDPRADAGGNAGGKGKGAVGSGPPTFLPAKTTEIEVPEGEPFEVDLEV